MQFVIILSDKPVSFYMKMKQIAMKEKGFLQFFRDITRENGDNFFVKKGTASRKNSPLGIPF